MWVKRSCQTHLWYFGVFCSSFSGSPSSSSKCSRGSTMTGHGVLQTEGPGGWVRRRRVEKKSRISLRTWSAAELPRCSAPEPSEPPPYSQIPQSLSRWDDRDRPSLRWLARLDRTGKRPEERRHFCQRCTEWLFHRKSVFGNPVTPPAPAVHWSPSAADCGR